jgi:hypothetical protein
MLPAAGQVGEFEIHEFYFVVFDHFADVGCGFFFGHVTISELRVQRWKKIGGSIVYIGKTEAGAMARAKISPGMVRL